MLSGDRSSEGVDQQPTTPKEAKLFSSVGAQVTQKDINRLVAGFIVEYMLPLSTIESHRFRKIPVLDKMPATRKPKSDRKKTLTLQLPEVIKLTFNSLDHVSTTADIWSANNKSYLGMRVHWIDVIRLYNQINR